MSNSSVDRQAHRAKSTLIRKGGTVKDCSNGTVVFDGMQAVGGKTYPWCKNIKGTNAAKRYVRKSGAVSYTVR